MGKDNNPTQSSDAQSSKPNNTEESNNTSTVVTSSEPSTNQNNTPLRSSATYEDLDGIGVVVGSDDLLRATGEALVSIGKVGYSAGMAAGKVGHAAGAAVGKVSYTAAVSVIGFFITFDEVMKKVAKKADKHEDIFKL